jgi:hypothetical protein
LKFGADVAGPAAVAILEEALGSRRDGARPPELSPEGFAELNPRDTVDRLADSSRVAGSTSGLGRGVPLPWEEEDLAAR